MSSDWIFSASRLSCLTRCPMIIFLNGERTKHWQKLKQQLAKVKWLEHRMRKSIHPSSGFHICSPKISQWQIILERLRISEVAKYPKFCNWFKEGSWGFPHILNQEKTAATNYRFRAVASYTDALTVANVLTIDAELSFNNICLML